MIGRLIAWLTAGVAVFAISFLASAGDKKAELAKEVVRIEVPGMVCFGCAGHVTKSLGELKGADQIYVDPVMKIALVTAKQKQELSDEALKKAVKEAGYEATKIERVALSFEKAKAQLEKKSS